MHSKIDLLVGLFLMALSTAGYILAGRFPPAPKGLGPGDYPRVILALLFLLGSLLAGSAFYNLKKRTIADKTDYERGELKQVFLLVAVVAAYIKLLSLFGYLLLTPFAVFGMMYLFGLRKWMTMALISIATSVFTFVLFNNYLYVLLPRFNLF